MSTSARAATEQEIEAAIEKGLAWLASQQNLDGSWGPELGCDLVARTGLVVLKFEDRARELGFDDPMDPNYEYFQEVRNGLSYIVANSHDVNIAAEPNADGDSDGIGTTFNNCGGHDVYNTGIAMMALAASQRPDLYGDLLQDALDWMSFAQNNPDCGIHRGGWRYSANPCNDSDNSTSGYATLGLGFAAAAPPLGFGLTIPQFVLDELDLWIDALQDPVDGDPCDGGSWYVPGDWAWVNILKTGNLLYEMRLVGDTKDTQRVKDAIDYIERHWNDPDAGGNINATGWLGHRQAMFTMMKGLEGHGIDTLIVDGNEIDWFDEVSTHLVETQDVNGAWPSDPWTSQILSTAWALLTLEKVVPNEPPDCGDAYADPSCLWPPNHKFVPVNIMGVTDPDGDPVTIVIISITSDEPTATQLGAGGPIHAPDADGVGTDTALLRAERSGRSNGRVYVINFIAIDPEGAACRGSVEVRVPHDQRPSRRSPVPCRAVDDGQRYDATEINNAFSAGYLDRGKPRKIGGIKRLR
jgi:hypothetical protein